VLEHRAILDHLLRSATWKIKHRFDCIVGCLPKTHCLWTDAKWSKRLTGDNRKFLTLISIIINIMWYSCLLQNKHRKRKWFGNWTLSETLVRFSKTSLTVLDQDERNHYQLFNRDTSRKTRIFVSLILFTAKLPTWDSLIRLIHSIVKPLIR
jgi:hypothetical protein